MLPSISLFGKLEVGGDLAWRPLVVWVEQQVADQPVVVAQLDEELAQQHARLAGEDMPVGIDLVVAEIGAVVAGLERYGLVGAGAGDVQRAVRDGLADVGREVAVGVELGAGPEDLLDDLAVGVLEVLDRQLRKVAALGGDHRPAELVELIGELWGTQTQLAPPGSTRSRPRSLRVSCSPPDSPAGGVVGLGNEVADGVKDRRPADPGVTDDVLCEPPGVRLVKEHEQIPVHPPGCARELATAAALPPVANSARRTVPKLVDRRSRAA